LILTIALGVKPMRRRDFITLTLRRALAARAQQLMRASEMAFSARSWTERFF